MAGYNDPTLTATKSSERLQPGPVLVLVAGLLSLALAGVFWFRTSQLKSDTTSAQVAIAQKNSELAALKPVADELSSYDTLAKNLHTVFDNQIRWEMILSRVESHLYRHMKISSLSITDKGQLTMIGVTPDFDNYARLAASLNNPDVLADFTTARAQGVTKNQDGTIGFSYQITLSPKLMEGKSGEQQ